MESKTNIGPKDAQRILGFRSVAFQLDGEAWKNRPQPLYTSSKGSEQRQAASTSPRLYPRRISTPSGCGWPGRALYLTAVFTGLRRGELAALEWDDVHLDAKRPFLNARASTTKNRKEAVISLHEDVVAELRSMQPTRAALNKRVFEGLMPRIKRFRADLKKANVDYINAKGQRADFHSLRYTLATNLALAGTPPRVAMEIMRHSDMRLTAKTYTDAGLLPVWDNVASLPSFNTDPPVKDSQNSQIDSQNLVRTSPSLSVPGKEIANLTNCKLADKQDPTSNLSGPVTTSQENGKWSGRQDSNLRPRGPKPRALPS